jgi:heterodisulfide reductase subunit C
MADSADYTVSQIVRLLQLGKVEEVSSSSMIWLCTGCETCGTRCPNEINMAPVMDLCKQLAVEMDTVSERKIEAFHKVFLKELRKRGRMHEMGLIMGYKLKTKDLFSDLMLGAGMFLKGKLKLLPSKLKDKRSYREFIESVEEERR